MYTNSTYYIYHNIQKILAYIITWTPYLILSPYYDNTFFSYIKTKSAKITKKQLRLEKKYAQLILM